MLSETTKEKNRTGQDGDGEEAAPHPFDRWLQRELRALVGDAEPESLPPDIAGLAAKLEEKLGGAAGRDEKPESERSSEDE